MTRSQGATTTTDAPGPPDHRLGFVSTEEEVSVTALPVRGTIPAWLDGALLRNGPAKFEDGRQGFRHWFDGLAMLHRFAFAGGRVAYANRFLDSPDYRAVRERGRIGYSTFATDPCRSIFARVAARFTGGVGLNANVSIGRVADQFVAWTETPLPIAFDPETLRAAGVLDWEDRLDATTTTPHPLTDPASGDTFNNLVRFGGTSRYTLHRIPAGERRRLPLAALPVREPAYMHSFGLTAGHLVLAEYPLTVNPLRMLLRGRPFAENLRWRPERPTRFLIARRDGGGWLPPAEGAAFFCFHHVNAQERDGELLVDLLAYPDPTIIDALYLDRLRRPAAELALPPLPELRRCRVPLDGGAVRYERLARMGLELPRINDRHRGWDYRYVYGVGQREDGQPDFQNQLVKVDLRTGDAAVWHEAGCYPGEPVFVAAPGARAEDDGVLLSVVLDARRGRSFLLVLDAPSLGELARAEAPHRIPLGFHGCYAEGTAGS